MKILYLKENEIFGNSGGSIEAKKIFLLLQSLSKQNENLDFKCISSDKQSNLIEKKVPKTKIKIYLSRFFLHSSSLFIDWKFLKLKKLVKISNPDIVILASSRLGFIAKYLKRAMPTVHVIGHFDNIEYDYVEAAFAGKQGILNKLKKRIEKCSVKRDEANFIRNIDTSLFLTERDMVRAQKLYGLQPKNSKIIPICIEKQSKELYISNEAPINLVFLGSLWYMSNINAIKWFLDNVWDEMLKINTNIKLIIGGSNPSNEFKRYLKGYKNVILYANFDKKEDIIPVNSIFISPIIIGAGMKVKIAEALAMGLMVIASSESLIGYSEALNDELNKEIIIKADTLSEYKNAIAKCLENPKDFKEISYKAKLLYERYYSLDRAYRDFQEILNATREPSPVAFMKKGGD